MFYTIAIDLVGLWILGLIASFTLGGVIYILPVIAIVMILLSLINDHRFIQSTIKDLMDNANEKNKIRN
ncbi:MAG: lmo0937 family membrane protein [Ignavibacteriales bacterium]|nr:lmo0937 family membrane protein [Ignavibacteriales bacterium]